MTTVLGTPEVTSVPELIERCDACGASAKAEITLSSGGTLAFCGHHVKKHAAGLAGTAKKVTVEDGFDWATK